MREKKKGVYQKYLKNLLDRLLALVGTAALSWLLLGVGIAVRLDSPGPVLFRQKRVAGTGSIFTYTSSARCVSTRRMICRHIC